MRRSAPIVICCAWILLLGVAEAIAGAAGGAPPPNSKSTGPSVAGTILISPPSSDASGTFSIRLTKGSLSSGATVISTRVEGYGVGCTTDPTVLANRFLGGPLTPGGKLSAYFDDPNVLIEIFRELGITIVPILAQPGSYLPEPIITDVASAVCSPPNLTIPPPSPDLPGSANGTLSLDVTIQFAITK